MKFLMMVAFCMSMLGSSSAFAQECLLDSDCDLGTCHNEVCKIDDDLRPEPSEERPFDPSPKVRGTVQVLTGLALTSLGSLIILTGLIAGIDDQSNTAPSPWGFVIVGGSLVVLAPVAMTGVGKLFNANGHVLMTSAGFVVGAAATFALGFLEAQIDSPTNGFLAIGSAFVLPFAGALIGYELTNDRPRAPEIVFSFGKERAGVGVRFEF